MPELIGTAGRAVDDRDGVTFRPGGATSSPGAGLPRRTGVGVWSGVVARGRVGNDPAGRRGLRVTLVAVVFAVAVAVVVAAGYTAHAGPRAAGSSATAPGPTWSGSPGPLGAAPPPHPMPLTGLGPGPAGESPQVVLTFDDGPDPRWTPQVLGLLARYHAPAVFCMIADRARSAPRLVTSVRAAGHRVCDHTVSHDEHLSTRPDPVVAAQISDARNILVRLGGGPVELYRAPGGRWSATQLAVAVADRMQPLGWSVDPRDWHRPGVAAIVARVEHQIRPGAIVLLHDGGGDRSQTVAALAQLLPWLDRHGYRAVLPTP